MAPYLIGILLRRKVTFTLSLYDALDRLVSVESVDFLGSGSSVDVVGSFEYVLVQQSKHFFAPVKRDVFLRSSRRAVIASFRHIKIWVAQEVLGGRVLEANAGAVLFHDEDALLQIVEQFFVCYAVIFDSCL